MGALKNFAAAVAVVAGFSGAAQAAEGIEIPTQEWSFQGPFGTFDRAALQRGFQVYREVCAACHSMDLLAYRNLEEIGYTPEQTKAVAAEYTVVDGPNDAGEMFERAALPSDRFVSPFPNPEAARAAFGGALPPDLSLLAKARVGGPDYIYAVLTGYEEAPAGFEVGEGKYYNAFFPGHVIGMPDMVNDDTVAYAGENAPPATEEQIAHDVATFLMWAAEPNLEARHTIGAKVMIFLTVFAVLMFFVKRRLWRDVH